MSVELIPIFRQTCLQSRLHEGSQFQSLQVGESYRKHGGSESLSELCKLTELGVGVVDRDLNPDLSHLKTHVLPDLLLGSLAVLYGSGRRSYHGNIYGLGVIEMLQGRGSVRGHLCCLPINHKMPSLFTCRKIACKPSF